MVDLRYAYSNTKNVELDISESTVDEFKFSIVDNNSLKYLYNEDCQFSLSKDGVSLFKREPFKMETIEEHSTCAAGLTHIRQHQLTKIMICNFININNQPI